MADRVGVINNGELILVEGKTALMHKLGKKQMTIELQQKLDSIPVALAGTNLVLTADGHSLTYTYDSEGDQRGVTRLIEELLRQSIRIKDIHTTQSSLEDIFVDLVRNGQ
jgi:ABC-2 type transport system ATP-binding protein